MNKYIITFLLLILVIPETAFAVKPPKKGAYVPPESIPAKIDGIIYITGLPEIDTDKYVQKRKYKGWFELNEKGAAYRRSRAVQTKAGKKGRRRVEEIDILRFDYPDIKELYFGRDAIKRSRSDLPTAEKVIHDDSKSAWTGIPVYTPLPDYLTRKTKAPIIIIFKRGDTVISLVVRGGPGKIRALYNLLAKQTGLKVKPPSDYP